MLDIWALVGPAAPCPCVVAMPMIQKGADIGTGRFGEAMYDDEARRVEIAGAGKRLEAFLNGLSPDDLARHSACEGWTVADVVGHLVERGQPIPDQIERGLVGDLSPTPGVSTAPPTSEDQFRVDLDRAAVSLRKELGDGLLGEFSRVNREFDRVLEMVGADDWEKPCYHRLRPETVRSKVDIRIAELAMHEWDIHWALDPNATLAEDSLPGLVNASGRAVRRAFRADPSRDRAVRYRFELSGPGATSLDVALAPEGATFEIGATAPSPDVVFQCSTGTYSMLIFGRLKLGPAMEQGLIEAQGVGQLIREFIDAFVGG